MNVLFVTGIFAVDEKDRALGGMPYAVYKCALGMQNRGHRVRILASSNRDRRWYYLGLDVISVKTHPMREEDGAWNVLFGIVKREICIEKSIRKLNQEEPIDIIQYTGWFGIGLFHSSTIPAVMRISSYTKVQLSYNYHGTKKWLLEVLDYLAAKRMNYVFAPGRMMARGIERDIGKKIGVWETPFLWDAIQWDDSILRGKLKEKRYILYFGRLSTDKGIFVIRDILHEVLDKNREICFVFVGTGVRHNGISVGQELLRAAGEYKDRVLALGWLGKDKLMPVISGAEMILMPSLADNFPNACAEAMALGKIVIGTNGSSLEQFIQDGISGYLVEIGNDRELLHRVLSVLEMGNVQKEIISNNAKQKVKELNLEDYSRNMEKVYRKVIGLIHDKCGDHL